MGREAETEAIMKEPRAGEIEAPGGGARGKATLLFDFIKEGVDLFSGGAGNVSAPPCWR